ncbi:hypothetical protein N7494_010901 [Penicillium frequentans]|uniref:5'-3' DNA helicase ZGRF1-like N-terminal domain-containing protein n=1 Tax=Penicillium frequentans TaxID=3151616 RepID=A0AAD6CJ83_9EURO|nr:hypothetical protein N7494_010901 [Penicillium glabrum]
MSTPSSSRGPGPSPGSQITASVVKFRCLFTYDLRRKSKRWQDGYLKYHAFNKRAMVYDEQGNYIGDHHWRSAEEVQEGDELELDKGVLIEVGERMSTTQTDLSNLFEKRRSQTSPQTRNYNPASDSQPPRSSTSISTPTYTPTSVRSSASSHPFRSLNDLLGIRKTPVGHLVSPYEERHGPPAPAPALSAPEPERATKRAKISTGRTTSNVSSDVVDLTGPENGPLRQRAPVRATPPEKDSRPTMPPPEKPVAVARLPSPSIPTPIQPPPTKPTANHAPLPDSTVQDKHPERPAARSQPKDKSPAVPDDARFEKPAAPRMTMQKPRNKFMYSTLQQQPSSVSSTTITEKQRRLPISNPTDSHKQAPQASTRREVESANTEFLPSDATQFALEDIAAPSGFENGSSRNQRPAKDTPRILPARRSFDAPLRKSLSDPSALNNKPSLQARPTPMRSAMSAVPEEPEVLEEGPWTAEALDLFDFWPPGRPKPV